MAGKCFLSQVRFSLETLWENIGRKRTETYNVFNLYLFFLVIV